MAIFSPRGRRRLAVAVAGALQILLPASDADAADRGFWLSLLVPGWGQVTQGNTNSGYRFMATEAALWAGHFGLRRLADTRQVNYETYAAEHADAHPQGRDGQYFDDLGFYESRHQHNQFARVDDGPDAELYPDTAAFFWEWDHEASRERYRDLRNAAQTADRNAVYITGLVVINHVAAAIHAARAGPQPGLEAATDPPVELQLVQAIDRVGVTLLRRF